MPQYKWYKIHFNRFADFNGFINSTVTSSEFVEGNPTLNMTEILALISALTFLSFVPSNTFVNQLVEGKSNKIKCG